jgi:branched-chain amino acid transport system substrate-binding protein
MYYIKDILSGGVSMKGRHLLCLSLLFCMIVWGGVSIGADEWGEIIIPKDKPIKIGFGAALSGAYAKLGIDIQHGAELAISEAKELAGHKWELVAGDDQCEGAPSVALAEKYCADPEIVAVVGFMCSGGSLPASEAMDRCKKIMISPSSTHMDLTRKGFKNVFRVCPNDAAQGVIAGRFIAKELKAKRLAIIHDKSAYGQGIADVVKATAGGMNVEVVAFEGITRGDKDFTAVLTKIKPLKPDVIYFGGMAAEGALIARQIKDVGIKCTFMGDEGLHDEKDFIAAAGKAAEGSYITAPATSRVKSAIEFEEKFKKKYGPLGVFTRQGYDCTLALIMAIEKSAKKEADGSLVIGKKALADALRSVEFSGATGKVAFDENGDNKGALWKVDIVKAGKFVEFKERPKEQPKKK